MWAMTAQQISNQHQTMIITTIRFYVQFSMQAQFGRQLLNNNKVDN